jgi:hypothetical protein
MLTVAPKGGLVFSARRIRPTGGLEVKLFPELLERRLSFHFGFLYQQISREVADEGLVSGSANTKIETQLVLVPLSLGSSYEIFTAQDWKVYAGASLRAVPYAHAIETDLFDPPIDRGIGIGFEVLAGLELHGFFFDLGAGYVAFPSSDAAGFSGAEVSVLGLLGHRFGVL